MELSRIADEVAKHPYNPLTSRGQKRKHADDGDDDAAPGDPAPGGSTLGSLEDQSVQESLNKAGYELEPTDSMLVPITPVRTPLLLAG